MVRAIFFKGKRCSDWAECMAHVEVFWQHESYAASVWTGTYVDKPLSHKRHPLEFHDIHGSLYE